MVIKGIQKEQKRITYYGARNVASSRRIVTVKRKKKDSICSENIDNHNWKKNLKLPERRNILKIQKVKA